MFNQSRENVAVVDTVERPVRARERRLLGGLLERMGDPPIEIRLWDDTTIAPRDVECVARVHVGSPDTLTRILRDPEMNFGEAYRDGEIEIDDLPACMEAICRHAPLRPRRHKFHLLRSNSQESAKRNIHHHYDIGNDFYRLWLDPGMVYSCAYFPRPGMSLAEAQRAKLELIARKLRVREGERVVDIGSGWGALAVHIAATRGAHVRGFSVSHEQVAYARDLAQRAGLAGRVEFIEDDYRNLSGTYDVIASIGMLEHVGIENYSDFSDVLERCLSRDGRGLIQTIGCHKPLQFSRWIEARIFPGAEPPSLGEMMRIFETHDFAVLDVENLRLHYAETLRHWLANFEARVDSVRAMYDEDFVRTWRMYLASSAAAFETGVHQLYQVLFNRRACNEIPRTRSEGSRCS